MNRFQTRRRFLAGIAAVAAGTAAAQQPPPPAPAPGAADPLRDPGSVGQLRDVATTLDNDEVIKGIERRLKCVCGCNLDIFTCRTTDFTCTYSPELHREIVGLFTAGKGPEEIVAAFVAKHGEQILLAPPARGFNLMGYLLPGALVLLAGGTLGFLLLRRHRSRLVAAAPAGVPTSQPGSPTLSAEDEERLARALNEIES